MTGNMDPRKPVQRPDPDMQGAIRGRVYEHLLAVTEAGARSIGCTGASFVIMGVGIWGAELSELHPRAAAQMMRALADIYDPATNPTQKARAEKKRCAAVNKLLATVDLHMANPRGSS